MSRTAVQPLLVFLLPLPADVEFLFPATEVRRGFPFEFVPVDRQREIEGELVIHELPHRGEGQDSVFQFHLFEFRVL